MVIFCCLGDVAGWFSFLVNVVVVGRGIQEKEQHDQECLIPLFSNPLLLSASCIIIPSPTGKIAAHHLLLFFAWYSCQFSCPPVLQHLYVVVMSGSTRLQVFLVFVRLLRQEES